MTMTQSLTSRDLQFHWGGGEQISEPKITAQCAKGHGRNMHRVFWSKKEQYLVNIKKKIKP